MQPQHLLCAFLALACQAQPARGGADESLDELKKKKVEVAAKWVEMANISFGGDIIPPREKMLASRALMDALLDAAKEKKDRLEARQIYYDSMKQIHAKIKMLADDGAVGGELRWTPRIGR